MCRVLTSQVEDLLFSLPPEKAALESRPYRLGATYEWERAGRTFTGSGVGGSQFGTRGAAERALASYPPGALVQCYVNPRDAAEASLRRPRLWPLLLLGFPLLFVGFGIAGIVATWRGGWRRPKAPGVSARGRALRHRRARLRRRRVRALRAVRRRLPALLRLPGGAQAGEPRLADRAGHHPVERRRRAQRRRQHHLQRRRAL